MGPNFEKEDMGIIVEPKTCNRIRSEGHFGKKSGYFAEEA